VPKLWVESPVSPNISCTPLALTQSEGTNGHFAALRYFTLKYETFVRQYETAADELADRANDPRLRGLSIAKRQFERWLSGAVRTEPYPDHCRVLEYLFGRPVRELLASASKELEPTRPTRRAGNAPPGEAARWSFGPADPARVWGVGRSTVRWGRAWKSYSGS